MDKNYISQGMPVLTPMLAIRNAAKAIEWYKKALNAKELSRLTEPNGKIAHAEIEIFGALIMIAEEHPDYNRSPDTLGGTSVILNLYVPNVDAVVERAITEKASVIFPVKDQFYGARAGRIKDPFGHMWIISTHIKNVTVEEMQKHINLMAQ